MVGLILSGRLAEGLRGSRPPAAAAAGLTNRHPPVRAAHRSVPIKGLKARVSAKARRPGCRDCPFRGSFGECLDPTLRSGRCGDWVFQVLPGNKQVRHLYVKPRDPRTARQRSCRERLGAASRAYSTSLTPEQQRACIAAGARRRSRTRLGQSGWLTGQQYWVSGQCRAKPKPSVPGARKPAGALQTGGILAPTSGTRRASAVIAPGKPSPFTRSRLGRLRPRYARGLAPGCWGGGGPLAPNRFGGAGSGQLIDYCVLSTPPSTYATRQGTPRSAKATIGYPKATSRLCGGQPVGTPKPPRSHPKATLRPP